MLIITYSFVTRTIPLITSAIILPSINHNFTIIILPIDNTADLTIHVNNSISWGNCLNFHGSIVSSICMFTDNV